MSSHEKALEKAAHARKMRDEAKTGAERKRWARENRKWSRRARTYQERIRERRGGQPVLGVEYPREEEAPPPRVSQEHVVLQEPGEWRERPPPPLSHKDREGPYVRWERDPWASKTPEGAGRVGLWVEPVIEEPSLTFFEEPRLDDQPFPGEATFAERLHGVKGEYVAPPGAIKSLARIGESWERFMGRPSRFLRERAGGPTPIITDGKITWEKGEGLLSKAEEAKLAGKDIKAGALFSQYMGIRAGAGIYDIFTSLVRPKVLYESVRTGVGLIVDPKVRKGAVEYAKADPGGVSAELAGSVLGARLMGQTITGIKTRYRAWHEARFEAKYPAEEFLPYEQELLTPQPTQELGIKGITETVVKEKGVVWDFRGDRASISISQKTPLKEVHSDWDLLTKGGTAITKLKEKPGYMKVWKPIIDLEWRPGLRISDIGPTITDPLRGGSRWAYLLALGGLTTTQEEKDLSKSVIETKVWEDPAQRLGDIPTFKEPSITVEEPRIIEMAGRKQIQRPLVYPLTTPNIIQETIQTPQQRQRQKQEPKLKTILEAPSISIGRAPPPTTRKRLRPLYFREERRRRPKGLMSFKAVTEVRLRPIKPPRLRK